TAWRAHRIPGDARNAVLRPHLVVALESPRGDDHAAARPDGDALPATVRDRPADPPVPDDELVDGAVPHRPRVGTLPQREQEPADQRLTAGDVRGQILTEPIGAQRRPQGVPQLAELGRVDRLRGDVTALRARL